jgi:Spy/CpxP family protein refolding chaperone
VLLQEVFTGSTITETIMRRMAAVLTLALVTGCSGDVAGPSSDDTFLAELAELASFGYGAVTVGDPGPGENILARLAALPPELALTADQLATINALVDAMIAATAADREALAAIRERAVAARADGATRDEVLAILAEGDEYRVRLHDAQRTLHRSVMEVLTREQRAALTGREPRQPGPCTLTDAQRTEISGLRAAYEQEYADDVALVRDVRTRALAAIEAGATRAEVRAILAEAHDAVQRLREARTELRAAVQAVLTDEQRAAGCMR